MSVKQRPKRDSCRFSAGAIVLVSAGGIFACSSGYEEAPVGDFAKPPGTGGRDSGNSGGFISGEGGDGGDSMGGDAHVGFGGAVTGPDPEPSDNPLCPVDAEWGDSEEVLNISTALGVERLLAVSPNERTMVFLRDDVSYIADRAGAEVDFSVATPLAIPDGYDLELGVALSPDGLTLVLTHEGSTGFGEITRLTRSDPFSLVANEAPYFVLNTLFPMAGVELSHPVIAAQGKEFWWVETRAETSVWFTRFDTEELARGAQVGCNELGCTLMLDGYDGYKKLLTGLSEDRLTVFIVDDVSGQQARTRAHAAVDAGFFEELPLAPRLDVRPNAKCTKLYYSREGDIFFDTR